MYQKFLKRYGCGGVGRLDLYGVINKDTVNSSVPDAIWLTIDERKVSNLHPELVIISGDGMGNDYCLNCVNVNKEGESSILKLACRLQQDLALRSIFNARFNLLGL